jgi:hypothetical protein
VCSVGSFPNSLTSHLSQVQCAGGVRNLKSPKPPKGPRGVTVTRRRLRCRTNAVRRNRNTTLSRRAETQRVTILRVRGECRMNLLRFIPVPELLIVAAIAAAIFGPRTLWRLCRR